MNVLLICNLWGGTVCLCGVIIFIREVLNKHWSCWHWKWYKVSAYEGLIVCQILPVTPFTSSVIRPPQSLMSRSSAPVTLGAGAECCQSETDWGSILSVHTIIYQQLSLILFCLTYNREPKWLVSAQMEWIMWLVSLCRLSKWLFRNRDQTSI